MSAKGLRLDWEFEPIKNSLKIVVVHPLEKEAPGVLLNYKKSHDMEVDEGPTLSILFTTFMAERQHYKPSTLRSYRETWRYIDQAFGPIPAMRITRHELAVFKSELASRYAPRTVNRIVGLLRGVMKFAFENGLAEANPAQQLHSLREETPDIDPFTWDELRAVFNALRGHHRQYYIAALWSGARPCELQALRWKDVSFATAELNINKARVRGKEGTPKTKRSRRIIPLIQPALEAFKTQHMKTGSDPYNYVFVTRGGDPITKHMDEIWKKACIRAGVKPRPPYQLRHTFASLMLAAGEAPAYVARVLGHTTTETLYRHYARWIPNATSIDGARFASEAGKLRF